MPYVLDCRKNIWIDIYIINHTYDNVYTCNLVYIPKNKILVNNKALVNSYNLLHFSLIELVKPCRKCIEFGRHMDLLDISMPFDIF